MDKLPMKADQELEDDTVYTGDDQAPEEEITTSWDQPEEDEEEL